MTLFPDRSTYFFEFSLTKQTNHLAVGGEVRLSKVDRSEPSSAVRQAKLNRYITGSLNNLDELFAPNTVDDQRLPTAYQQKLTRVRDLDVLERIAVVVVGTRFQVFDAEIDVGLSFNPTFHV